MRSGKGRGFTLIEMLVVMAMIAMLLTIALPRYFGSLERSRDAVLHENLRVMRDLLDKYHADKGRYPDQLADLVSQKYIVVLPMDPVTESNETWQSVMSTDADQPGVADVHSGAPGADNAGNSYAAY